MRSLVSICPVSCLTLFFYLIFISLSLCSVIRSTIQSMSRFTGLQFTGLPCLPVFFFVPPRHPGLPVVCRYTGVVHFFMLAEPLLLLHTPTHAAAHNTTQHGGQSRSWYSSIAVPRPSREAIGDGGRGCNKTVPVLAGDGTKIATIGDIHDQLPGGMSGIRGKLADHLGDHVVLSPEGADLVTTPGTKSSYPRPPQSLNRSVEQ